jgi:transcriptional regulator with XRE-family HTH domain
MAKKAQTRKRFTLDQKQDAIIKLKKGWTLAQVAEEIGCSVAALQLWKKEFKDGNLTLDGYGAEETEEQEEEDYTPAPTRTHKPQPTASTASRKDFVKSYWSKVPASAIMEMPSSTDDVIELIDNALKYAYDELSD